MLYICPTPIGNLGDITLRVLEVLKEADLVAAEDTRRSRQLLSHFGISKPLVSFYEHNEFKRLPELVERLAQGENIALVSDAGMPGICDPGYRLVQAALAAQLPVTVLPGPSAVETALVASGFATDAFVFWGYLPRKQGELKQTLAAIGAEPRSSVAFDSPHRLRKTLTAAVPLLGERPIAVCRELTKKFEEIKRGSAGQLLAELPETVKGEIVLVFAAQEAESAVPSQSEEQLRTAIAEMLEAGLSPKRTAELVAELSGAPRRQLYRMALEIKEQRIVIPREPSKDRSDE